MRLNFCHIVLLLFAAPFTAVAASAVEPSDSIVSGIVVVPVTAYADLGAEYSAMIGQQWQADRLADVHNSIVARYEEDGFFPPFVRTQVISDKPTILRIEIIEARLGQVQISGQPSAHEDALRAAIDRLRESSPLSRAAYQRFIRDVAELRVGQMKSQITRRPESAIVDLRLEFITSSIASSVGFTNSGSYLIGREIVGGEVRFHNFSRWAEEIGLAARTSLDSGAYRQFGARVATTTASGSLTARLFDSRLVIDEENYESDISHLILSYESAMDGAPLGLNWHTTIGIRDRDSVQNDEDFFVDSRRMELGLTTDRKSINFLERARVTLVQGIDGLGARTNQDMDLDGFSIEANYGRWQRLSGLWWLNATLGGQYSDDKLPGGQRYLARHQRAGTAFDAGELSGDTGFGTRLELRRLNALQWGSFQGDAFAFHDYTSLRDNSLQQSWSASSAGAGFSVAANKLSILTEVATALTGESLQTESVRVNVDVILEFD